MSLYLCPVTFDEAAYFIRCHHRHQPAPTGHKFNIGVAQDGEIVGVAMVGRLVARSFDDGWTLEVNRTCTKGTPQNANSMLYAAAWRAAKVLGYQRLITYTLASESGTSLRAAGWRVVAERKPRKGWNMPGRPRVDTTEQPRATQSLGGGVMSTQIEWTAALVLAHTGPATSSADER